MAMMDASSGAAMSSNLPLTGAAKLAEYARAKQRRHRRERVIEAVLLAAACVSVFTTLGIVYILLRESFVFFSHVPVWDFLT
jgi:phosphate transport system permease protein